MDHDGCSCCADRSMRFVVPTPKTPYNPHRIPTTPLEGTKEACLTHWTRRDTKSTTWLFNFKGLGFRVQRWGRVQQSRALWLFGLCLWCSGNLQPTIRGRLSCFQRGPSSPEPQCLAKWQKGRQDMKMQYPPGSPKKALMLINCPMVSGGLV